MNLQDKTIQLIVESKKLQEAGSKNKLVTLIKNNEHPCRYWHKGAPCFKYGKYEWYPEVINNRINRNELEEYYAFETTEDDFAISEITPKITIEEFNKLITPEMEQEYVKLLNQFESTSNKGSNIENPNELDESKKLKEENDSFHNEQSLTDLTPDYHTIDVYVDIPDMTDYYICKNKVELEEYLSTIFDSNMVAKFMTFDNNKHTEVEEPINDDNCSRSTHFTIDYPDSLGYVTITGEYKRPAPKPNKPKTQEEAISEIKDRLEIIYSIDKTPNSVVIRGEIGGDVETYEIFKDGSIYAK